jgi:hypothetical protein
VNKPIPPHNWKQAVEADAWVAAIVLFVAVFAMAAEAFTR